MHVDLIYFHPLYRIILEEIIGRGVSQTFHMQALGGEKKCM